MNKIATVTARKHGAKPSKGGKHHLEIRPADNGGFVTKGRTMPANGEEYSMPSSTEENVHKDLPALLKHVKSKYSAQPASAPAGGKAEAAAEAAEDE